MASNYWLVSGLEEMADFFIFSTSADKKIEPPAAAFLWMLPWQPKPASAPCLPYLYRYIKLLIDKSRDF